MHANDGPAERVIPPGDDRHRDSGEAAGVARGEAGGVDRGRTDGPPGAVRDDADDVRLDNTILYIPNGVFDASFDGWPTFIAFAASLVTYVAVALVTPVAPIRGLDIRVAEDLDDALGEVDTAEPEPELVKADAGPRLPTAP
jgi:hypothetical protein